MIKCLLINRFVYKVVFLQNNCEFFSEELFFISTDLYTKQLPGVFITHLASTRINNNELLSNLIINMKELKLKELLKYTNTPISSCFYEWITWVDLWSIGLNYVIGQWCLTVMLWRNNCVIENFQESSWILLSSIPLNNISKNV